MPHFFVQPKNIKGNEFYLAGEDVHYLLNVRRVRVGDEISIFDGMGKTYLVRISAAGKDEIRGVILKAGVAPSAKVKLSLYQSVPKGERIDWLVEKAAELGVGTLIPLVTERSVVKEINSVKVERWRRLSLAGSQQCGRADLMEIKDAVNFPTAVKNISADDINIILWEGEENRSLEDLFCSDRPSKNVNLFIGPEGGFTVGEVNMAIDTGIHSVSLGKRILRVETAGLLASILVLNSSGEYGGANKGKQVK